MSLTLEDGRECRLHELPIGVIEKVRTLSEGKEQDVRLDTIAFVAAHALTGCKPNDDEVRQLVESFGASTVMQIYIEAIKFSQLTPVAVEQEKKGSRPMASVN